MVVGVGYGGLVVFWMVYLYLKFVMKVVFVVLGIYMMLIFQKMLFVKFDYDYIFELLLFMIVMGLKNLVFVVIIKLVYRFLMCVCKGILYVINYFFKL